MASLSPAIDESIEKIHSLIATDAGGRGMRHLVVEGDLRASAAILARLRALPSRGDNCKPHVIILTGFPCCVEHDPPMETDGLASVAIAHAVVRLGYEATLVTEECNAPVFRAAVEGVKEFETIQLSFWPGGTAWAPGNDEKLKQLAESADLIVSCERAGPAADGSCYTMRGINMNERGLIAPLHNIVTHACERGAKFLAIGDGGNELGMGKVIGKIHEHIPDGQKIGAVTAADHLVAASVSNWGGYALIAAAALVRCNDESKSETAANTLEQRREWIERCMPTEESETRLLHRCVAARCRDGVSGQMEATVDGMPLERTMQCLREIQMAAMGE
ncbi:hypothetical protein ACHAXT_007431 [Thalassiosira profunda]